MVLPYKTKRQIAPHSAIWLISITLEPALCFKSSFPQRHICVAFGGKSLLLAVWHTVFSTSSNAALDQMLPYKRLYSRKDGRNITLPQVKLPIVSWVTWCIKPLSLFTCYLHIRRVCTHTVVCAVQANTVASRPCQTNTMGRSARKS